MYYFPTTDALASAVVVAVALRLQDTLDEAVADVASDHRELLRQAWPVLAHPDSDRLFALFFEANGLAASGRSPFVEIVPALVSAWLDWAADRISGEADHRRREAEATVALADGLLLFRQLAGPEAADRAAERLGIR